MMRFIDKQGRVIILQFNEESDLEAVHNNQIIGLFEFRFDDDYPVGLWELWHMNVDNAYQQSGIGSAMMQLAVKELEWFILPKPIHFPDAANYLTEEGAALVNHCFRNDIFPPNFRNQYERD